MSKSGMFPSVVLKVEITYVQWCRIHSSTGFRILSDIEFWCIYPQPSIDFYPHF